MCDLWVYLLFTALLSSRILLNSLSPPISALLLADLFAFFRAVFASVHRALHQIISNMCAVSSVMFFSSVFFLFVSSATVSFRSEGQPDRVYCITNRHSVFLRLHGLSLVFFPGIVSIRYILYLGTTFFYHVGMGCLSYTEQDECDSCKNGRKTNKIRLHKEKKKYHKTSIVCKV